MRHACATEERSGSGATLPGVPADDPAATPAPRGLDDLYDISRLAARLGVEHSTIRVWLSRRVPWLPPPDGRLNGGAVWRATTLEGIEERRTPGRPGRKPGFVPARGAADVARAATGTIPVVTTATGAIPVVATTTGALPLVATGAIPVVPAPLAFPVVVPDTVPTAVVAAAGVPTPVLPSTAAADVATAPLAAVAAPEPVA